jgi:tetratricopeptide (TPR) repeat protein
MSKSKKKLAGSRSGREQALPPAVRTFERAFASARGGAAVSDALRSAQDLIYQAFEIPNPAKRISLARRALAISPDCADAYVLLAEEQARTLEEALDYYAQGVDAGERALGAKTFEEDAGHFWGLNETRPYMSARLGLAQTLWEFGDRSAAIAHAQELLRLNPNDNQGVRHVLITWLLLAGRLHEAQTLWQRFEEDGMAHWRYSRALMVFLEQGAGSAADALLDAAIASNADVPPLLLGRTPLPYEPPEYIGFGDLNEAVAYVVQDLELWQQTDGALRWLKNVLAAATKMEQPTREL